MAEATLARVLGIGPWRNGPYKTAILDWTGSASYPAGGYTIDPKPLIGANTILGVKKIGGNAAAALYNIHWDTVNQKMMIIYPTGGAAPASLGAPSVAVPAGATPVTSTGAQPDLTETAGRGTELAASTDASSLQFRLEFIAA